MAFVDGENLTLRGQRFADTHGIALQQSAWFEKNSFLWIPGLSVIDVVRFGDGHGPYAIPLRSYYYATVEGGTDAIPKVEDSLWRLGFHPEVFHKRKDDTRAKGMDLTVARDLLSHAFRDNYDVALLFAGDGDYVPLVEEIKRLGKTVVVLFFSDTGLSRDLRMASDHFFAIDRAFEHGWRGAFVRLQAEAAAASASGG